MRSREDSGIDVVTLGECMVLLTPPAGQSLVGADSLLVDAAGAESTVALYLANLGHRVAWVSRVGSDPFGDRIARRMQSADVDVRYLVRDPTSPTGVFFKDPGRGMSSRVHYYRLNSAASHLSPGDLVRVPIESSRAVHVSGITPALSRSAAEATDVLLQRACGAGVLRSFDVNYRPALWPTTAAAPILSGYAQHSDLVFVGRDEASTLWGTTDAQSIRALLGNAHELVVKDGGVGATVFPNGSGEGVFVSATATDVLEPVGAGDAFAAGYLAGWLGGEPLEVRTRLAHQVAALSLGSMLDHVDASGMRPGLANSLGKQR